MRGAAQAALQDEGYRVVDESSPDYAGAMPLALKIEQFWAWFTPGFATVDASFKSRVVMTGDPVTGPGPTVAEGQASYSSGFGIFESDWTDLLQRGLADLSAKMKEKINAPSASPAKN